MNPLDTRDLLQGVTSSKINEAGAERCCDALSVANRHRGTVYPPLEIRVIQSVIGRRNQGVPVCVLDGVGFFGHVRHHIVIFLLLQRSTGIVLIICWLGMMI